MARQPTCTDLEVIFIDVAPHARVESAECEAEDLPPAEHAVETHHLLFVSLLEVVVVVVVAVAVLVLTLVLVLCRRLQMLPLLCEPSPYLQHMSGPSVAAQLTMKQATDDEIETKARAQKIFMIERRDHYRYPKSQP